MMMILMQEGQLRNKFLELKDKAETATRENGLSMSAFV